MTFTARWTTAAAVQEAAVHAVHASPEPRRQGVRDAGHHERHHRGKGQLDRAMSSISPTEWGMSRYEAGNRLR
jgi:hypothetical protein